MATDVGVGDVETPRMTVQPFDATTAATLEVVAPDGATTTPPVSPQDDAPEQGTQTWTADPVRYDQPGRWLLRWTVTGTGQSAETQEVYVVASPTAGGPQWIPGRTRVANYVPGRTLARDSETHELTFNSSTLPTGVQVDRLIADGVAWLRTRVASVRQELWETAATVVAVWAAAAVERGYPAESPEQSLRRAEELQRIAERMLVELATANGDPTAPAGPLPLYSFPDPPAWGDLNFL